MALTKMSQGDVSQAYAIHCAVQYQPWSKSTFEDCLDAPYEGWVYKHQQSLQGFCLLLFVLDEVTLMDIAVAQAHQGQGVGKAMLDSALRYCRSKGMRQCWLEVRESNSRAISLYRRLGFEDVEVRKGYYPTATGRENALVMLNTLNGQSLP